MVGDSLPANWRWLTLGEAVDPKARAIVSGPFGSNIGSRFFVEQGVPVIRGNNLTKDMTRFVDDGFVFLTEDKANELGNCGALTDDLIFTAAGSLGQVGIIPSTAKYPRYIISNKQLRARVDKRKVEPLFAFYWFSSKEMVDYIQQRNTGSSVPLINLGVLRSLPIPIPPLREQRAIAHILGTLDDKIELNRRMNETLEALARTLFKSWFVDFDPVRAKAEGRDSGLPKALADLFPDSFENSEWGVIPKGWTVARLGDAVSVVDFVANGSFASLKENVTLLDTPGYALFLRTTDYNKGFSGSFRFVSKESYDFLSKSALDGSEVVISNVGDVGTVFRPPSWLGWPMTLGSNAVALKPHGLSNYMFHYFNDPVGQDAIRSIVTGSAQPKFNKTNLRDLYIPIPSPPVTREFERQAATLAERSNLVLLDSKVLTALRDTLLPKLLSGELRVRHAARLVEASL